MASITNDVLGARLDNALNGISELKRQMDSLSSKYVDAQIYELRHTELQKDIASIKLQIVQLQNRKTFFGFMTPIFAAVLGSVFTYLILARFQ